MKLRSVQLEFAPTSTCFGCGPANARGLRIESRRAPTGPGLVATWQPLPEHEAFPGALNGGIIGTLLDCHSNWTAAVHLMGATGEVRPPSTVTADLAVRYLRPTPSGGPVTLHAQVIDASDRRATVDATLESNGAVCATSRATFVSVRPGHPAYGRW
jgi:acyl-coenzyme A thioesterase PaaI-like protein